MTAQLNIFDAKRSTDGGIPVKLDRTLDREHPCCRSVGVISAGKGPHADELHCPGCGQHRGWLSRSTAQWLEQVVTRFGAPATPIVLRKVHTRSEGETP
jgi:hypothetical protein